jgi:two-component system chemotaxis response regulator CheB
MEQPFETSPEEEAVPDPAEGRTLALEEDTLTGPPSALTCPDCGGALWERQNGDLVRYRCHVGHAFTAEGLMVGQDDALELALWSALRALQEKAELGHRMADRSRARGLHKSASQFEVSAKEAEHGSHMIRRLLLEGTGDPPLEAEQSLDAVLAGHDDDQPTVGRS